MFTDQRLGIILCLYIVFGALDVTILVCPLNNFVIEKADTQHGHTFNTRI